MERPEVELVADDSQAAGHESPPVSPHDVDFYPMLCLYLNKGARHCDVDDLAQILDFRSPRADERYTIYSALFEAIYRGDEVAVQMLLDAGVSPRRRERSDPHFTSLLAASQAGQLGMTRRFGN